MAKVFWFFFSKKNILPFPVALLAALVSNRNGQCFNRPFRGRLAKGPAVVRQRGESESAVLQIMGAG
jgi:hypothetical protein